MWNFRRSLPAVLSLTALSFLIPHAASAEPVTQAVPAAAPAKPSLEQRVELLDQTVRILQRRLEVKEENDTLKWKEMPVMGAGPDGFTFKSPKNDFQLSIKGLLQADGRFFVNQPDTRNVSTYLVRRVRPIIQGTVFDYFDFAFVPDFGSGNTVLQDAWLEYRYFPKAKLRFGKFKSQFGIERIQSAKDLEFVERALPTNLVPNRDEGIQLSGDFRDGLLTYAVSNVNGVNDGASVNADNNDSKDVVARVFVQPFKATSIEWLQNLGMGLAMSYGNAKGAPSSYLTAGQETFFRYNSPVTLDGQRSRYSPQFYYYWGRFGMMGEYVSSAQDLEIPPVNATRTTPAKPAMTRTLTNDAWQLAVYYVLTGEDASYRGVKPRTPFDMEAGTWGAWELVGRYGQLQVDEDTFKLGFANIKTSASKASEWSLGINWYLNRNLRYMLDYSRTGFDGGAADGNRDAENVFMTRMQIAF